jgi:(1->4)-alpha-D-glucan 1-alpha-D-glucosylmutase
MPPTTPPSPVPRLATIPRATYRVQLHREFPFAAATALVPYWAGLGISHLYTSPILRARPGSQHGYDVVDHGTLNPELGTREDFDQLVAALHAHDMGLIVDIVPNHMGVLGGDNGWWLDVLENGAASQHAAYFDIEWNSTDPVLAGRVLLPILGEQYGVVLERGELQLAFAPEHGSFSLHYYEHRLPIDPSRYGGLLRNAHRRLAQRKGVAGYALVTLAEAFEKLPAHHQHDEAACTQRLRAIPPLKERLGAAAREHPAIAEALAAVLADINGQAGSRASFDALDALIALQPWRLAQWRVAGDEINYRRFFDINELAALRMERPEVFADTHALILALAAEGAIDGLRIDHPDGLADPAAYFEQLQRAYAARCALPPPPDAGADGRPELPLYVVVEKIVAPHEEVPRSWAVHGTTGYRFANVVNNVLLDTRARTRMDRVWRAFAGDEAEDFDTLSWHCRHLVMEGALAGELTVLAGALLRLAREDRRTRDFTLNLLRQALAEVVACFPVYRSYVVDKPSPQDRRFIAWAIGRAMRRSRAADASVFEFLRRVLLGKPLPGAVAGLGARYRAFAQRLQQYTSPVAAKGIEDTALYRHQRLVSVNDVGGDPDQFGMTVAAFHAASRDRCQHWPHTMLATSTHDAKRSEDVRLRINMLSEMPAAWRLTVRRWSRMNRRLKRSIDDSDAPSRNDEYLVYQLLVGSLPHDADAAALETYAARLEQAVLKSARESKAVTSWINPHADYEAALSAFVHALLSPREGNLFLDDLRSTAALAAWHGALSGLSMVLLKFCAPGVPDVYQGHEGSVLSLVDPDNRRPVDYAQRQQWLADAQALWAAGGAGCTEALQQRLRTAPDGRAKFWVSWRLLQCRQAHPELFRQGDYLPLEVRGPRAELVVASARRHAGQWLVAVALRLPASLGLAPGALPVGDVWEGTEVLLPGGAPAHLRDTLTDTVHTAADGALPLATLFAVLPVAALHGMETRP